MSVSPRDLLFYAGGECLQRFGTLVWRPRLSHDLVPTHTRSGSVGPFIGSDGVLRQASANRPRIEWVDLDGDGARETPGLLLEAARTNELLRSEELDNASWTKTNTSIGANAAGGPDAAVSLDRITENSSTATHDVRQSVTGLTADANYAFSGWFKASSRTWVRLAVFETAASANFFRAWFNLSTGAVGTMDDGGTGTAARAYVEDWTHIAAGLYRCVVVGSVGNSATACTVQAALATGDAVTSYAGDGTSNAFGGYMQLEDDAESASSYIATTTATVTRNADTFYAPFTAAPQEMTVYVKFVELGTINITDAALLHIGSATASGDPHFTIQQLSGAYGVIHDPGTQAGATIPNPQPQFGDVVELAAVLYADGSVQLYGSINSGSVVTNGRSGTTTPALTSAWAGERLYLNSDGGSADRGLANFISVKAVAGVKTMAEMRSIFPRAAS